MGIVRLTPGAHPRLQAGHPWVFAGEIGQAEEGLQAGDVVRVEASNQRMIGLGFYNPHSQIRVRLLTHRADVVIGPSFFRERVQRAWERRQQLLEDVRACRVVHGEADFLPGLVADKYNDLLVCQILSFGMHRYFGWIADALEEMTGAVAIYLRSDVPVRRKEGLPVESGFYRGQAEVHQEIKEAGLLFEVDVASGQKTGFFFDQRDNRRALHPIAGGARVLECFCNTAAFGVHAAAAGAQEIWINDQSQEALTLAKENARRNGFAHLVHALSGNAFDLLRQLESAGERFDLIILDPPAFAKGRKGVEGALRGYKEINLRAMRLLKPGGYLATSSCSQPVDWPAWNGMLGDAAADAHRLLQVVYRGGQAADHPILTAVPESAYLKFGIFRVWPVGAC
ncbi:MAG: class I SAM-dependent rRNA methyltransferase [Firmicutes bacterium]|nr:class I SAM-dependent rRNA methyltransferase [Bacillota bacterium]